MDGVHRIGAGPVPEAAKLLRTARVSSKDIGVFYDLKMPQERLEASATEDVRAAYSTTSQVLLSNPVVANEYADKPKVTLNSYGTLLAKPTYKRPSA